MSIYRTSFKNIDKNNSGQLSRKEVFASLHAVFQKKLQDVDIACLTDFMMRQGEDEDQNVRKGQIIISRDVRCIFVIKKRY